MYEPLIRVLDGFAYLFIAARKVVRGGSGNMRIDADGKGNGMDRNEI